MSLLALLLVGAVLGTVIGMLGGGGGVLAVPMLVAIGEPVLSASTMSLVVVGTGAAAALVPHQRAHRVDWRIGLLFGALGSVGAVVGARLSSALPADLLLLGFGILVLLGAGLFMAFQFARRAFAGENHPILTALAKYGQPQFVRTAIDATIPEGAKTRGAGFLASNVMLFPSTYGMATFGVSDLVWAYRLNTRRNGVTTITLQMADKDGKQRATPALSDATATSMLKTLAETAPWMVVGYSAELEKSWKTNKQAFIQAVQDRRAAMQSQPNR